MKMDAPNIPMNTVSRRTRSQWDIFYRNLYNEVKGLNTQESGGTSVEKQDSGINGGNTGGVEITEDDEGSETRDAKRIRKKVSNISGSGKIGETVKKMIAEDDKNDNLAGVRMHPRSRKTFDMRAKNDDDDVGEGDDDVIYLGEEVVSNGLSSKVGSESRSGSHLKPSSADEIVSCSSKRVEKTILIAYQVKNSVVHGRGRPGTKHLNKRRPDDVSINLENAVDSDDSPDSWLYGSDSSSKDDASDEDYKEIEPSSSDGSHCSSDAKRIGNDEYELGDDDDSSIEINADSGEENSSHLQSDLISISQKKIHEHGKLNCPVIVLESDESASSTEEESESLIKEGGFLNKRKLKRSQATKKAVKLSKTKICLRRNFDMIRMLENSIHALGESASPTEASVWTQLNLPLKFRFEDEVRPPPERSEWEKEIDSLFGDLEMGLRECEIGYPNSFETDNDDKISSEIDTNPAACCQRGEHYHMLDEEIGVRCKYCEIVLLEIKYVLPTFYTPPLGVRNRKEF